MTEVQLPIGPAVHQRHEEMLARLAASGVAWAHKAQERASPLLYVAAGGFTKEFRAVAGRARNRVVLWSLKELYGRMGRRR